MKPTTILFILLNATISLQTTYTQKVLSYETIERGVSSSYTKPLQAVYRNQTEFETLWQNHTNDVLPDIDFTQNMVAVLFRGEHSTGGYGIEFTKVLLESDTEVRFQYRTWDPKEGDIVTQAFTQPHHLIKVEYLDEVAVFEESETGDRVGGDGIATVSLEDRTSGGWILRREQEFVRLWAFCSVCWMALSLLFH